MVELFENNMVANERKSSKGNQLKWGKDGKWYKADYTGYEGLSEYMVSHMLKKSNLNEKGEYDYCPIFDNGASLLSDTKMDYPLNVELNQLLKSVKPKTFTVDFDEQLEIAEKLYGQCLKFDMSRRLVEELLEGDTLYSQETKDRVCQIILWQMRKYSYLFG